MKNQKWIYLLLSIILYIASLLVFSLRVIGIEQTDNVIFSLFLSIMSFSLLMKFKEIKTEREKYSLLFLIAYSALVYGANFVFDFVIERLMIQYKTINNAKYEELWQIYVNDNGRNFLIFFGLFYSAIATFMYFLVIKILKKISKKI
ncbi:MAG: hypothetical protein J6Y75_01425 [Spirochaetaceae bacterium]|nr:hypothetical protein [Spirochaetaceae bacterium]